MSPITLALSTVLLSLAALLPTLPAQAEAIAKHPRVVELEDRISKDASAYMRGRFPDRPFIVTASVDPLRRREPGEETKSEPSQERLPYFDLQNEEIQDEWDDPQVSLNELIQRVRKIQIQVSLPDSVLDNEVDEIKSSMYASLHLLKARDEVVIERRPWKDSSNLPLYSGIGGVILVMFLLGSYLNNRVAIRKLTSAISENRGGSSAPAQGFTSGGAAPTARAETDPSREKGLPQDIQLSDPSKIREIAASLVAALSALPEFPGHLDMFELDQLGQKSPAALGAVLNLFPSAVQKKLFSLSYQPSWLSALHQPGVPSFESLEVLHRLARNPRDSANADWMRLIILVWRLDGKRAEFVRGMKREDALSMLSALPKSFSVATARKAFPGAWAEVLDPSHRHQTLSPEKIKELQARALSVCPLQDETIIERYKNEHELLEYLRLVDIDEEREIYLVSPANAIIHSMRPPFFKVLEGDEQEMKEFVLRYTPQQWALALLNSNRSYLRKVDRFFSEKQRYLFIENLKRYDIAAPERNQVGEIREYLARMYAARPAPVTPSPIAQAQESSGPKLPTEADADDAAA